MKTVPILFTFDQKLLMPAGVCLYSLLESADKDTFYDIFLLHGPGCDFSPLNILKERFDRFSLTDMEISGEFKGAYEIRGIPETAYYRLLSPELIPQYDKLLYSDVDVIIREDLSKYYEMDLGDHYFAAVDNCSRLRPTMQQYISGLGLDWRNNYYYSGNLVINSALIRRDKMIERFRELARNDYNQQDMDIINIACNQRFLPLGPVYCMTVQLYALIVNRRAEMEAIYGAKALDDALDHGIVHYNGAKPWKQPCTNMDIWWAFYRRSPFFDETFCQQFWDRQLTVLERLPLLKRIKMVLRYPIDKKKFKA